MKIGRFRPGASRAERMVAETSDRLPSVSARHDLASALGDADLFEGLSREETAAALSRFHEVRFPSGRRIVLEGLRGSDFFVVVAGAAAVLVDGWRVATLGPGDFFGEMAILGHGPRSASVRAETPLQCLVLPNGKLEELLVDHPQVGLNVMRTVIGRFQEVAAGRQPPASELATV